MIDNFYIKVVIGLIIVFTIPIIIYVAARLISWAWFRSRLQYEKIKQKTSIMSTQKGDAE